MMARDEDYELDRLQAELMQEKQMTEMLDQSLEELQVTVDELDSRMDHIDEENSEWKTRYDNQRELNHQLQKQIVKMQDKVDEATKTYRESRMPKTRAAGPEIREVNPYLIKSLEKEKDSLDKSLRDLEWRLDHESKAYHKANEERKHYVMEIRAAKGTINEMKVRQHHLDIMNYDPPNSSRSIGNQNIPPDQRILDGKKGPIRKTAAVKTLPRLD